MLWNIAWPRQEAEAKRAEVHGAGADEPGAEESRRENRQRAMQEGLLESHGLEFDKKWIRLLRVIKSQVRPCK